MASGKRGDEQEDLFVTHQQLRAQSHPYYRAMNKILRDAGFDRFAEATCAKFFAKTMGRPSLPVLATMVIRAKRHTNFVEEPR